MASSLISAILFIALVLTSVCALALLRRIKALGRYHEDYRMLLERSASDLGTTSEVVTLFSAESKAVLHALGAKVEEAKALLADLDARREKLPE